MWDRVSDPVRPSKARQFVRTEKLLTAKIAEKHRKGRRENQPPTSGS